MGLFGKPDVQKMSKEENIRGLANALKHKDPGVRLAAAKALYIKAKVLTDFIINHALESESDEAKGYFAQLLVAHVDRYYRIGDLSGNLLVRMRTLIDDPRFLASMAGLLKNIQIEAVKPLTSALQDPNEEVRRTAVETLEVLRRC